MDTGRQGRNAALSLARRLMTHARKLELMGRWCDANDLMTAALVLRELAAAPASVDGQLELLLDFQGDARPS